MKKTLILITLISSFLNHSFAQVTEMGVACVRYQKDDNSYSKAEAAPYAILIGNDINMLFETDAFSPRTYYALVEWPANDISVFDIKNHVTLPYFDFSTKDQKDKAHKIKKSPNERCM